MVYMVLKKYKENVLPKSTQKNPDPDPGSESGSKK